MPEAVIVSAVRTPVGRAYKGSLRATRPDDLAALVIKEALARVPGLDPKEIDDVILGCAMPEGEQGMNVARIAALARRSAGRNFRHDHQSLLLLRTPSHRACRRTHPRRLRAGHHRRRHRKHVHGPHGRQQNFSQSLAGRQLSRRLHQHGPRHRKHRAQIRHHPRTSRSVRCRLPQKSRSSNRRRKFQR